MDREKLKNLTELLAAVEMLMKFPKFNELQAKVMEEAVNISNELNAPTADKPGVAPMREQTTGNPNTRSA